MKTIQLTKGYFTVVDEIDYERLSVFRWHALIRRRKDGVVTCVYAARHGSIKNGQKRTYIYMHREILGLHRGRNPEVDHHDNNGLNNQRTNLRLSSGSQNKANARLRVDNTSGRKGVRWDQKNGKWKSEITVNGKLIWLGRFVSLEDASHAHDEAAKLYFGEFFKESVAV